MFFSTVGEECYSIEHVPNDGGFCRFMYYTNMWERTNTKVINML